MDGMLSRPDVWDVALCGFHSTTFWQPLRFQMFPLWFCAFCCNQEAKTALCCTCTSPFIQSQTQFWNSLFTSQAVRVMTWRASNNLQSTSKIAVWGCHNWRSIFSVSFAVRWNGEKSVIRNNMSGVLHKQNHTPSISWRDALCNITITHTRVLN